MEVVHYILALKIQLIKTWFSKEASTVHPKGGASRFPLSNRLNLLKEKTTDLMRRLDLDLWGAVGISSVLECVASTDSALRCRVWGRSAISKYSTSRLPITDFWSTLCTVS